VNLDSVKLLHEANASRCGYRIFRSRRPLIKRESAPRAHAGADREAGGISDDADHTRSPLAILYSDNLEASEQKVRSAGGKIVKPIFSFPGGRRFHFTDPSGNELAVWSDK